MVFKKLHLGTVSYNDDTFDEVVQSLRTYFSNIEGRNKGQKAVRKSALIKCGEAVKALSLCHNVTPVYDCNDYEATEADQDFVASDRPISYQASSPDEVALVQWSEEMGLALVERTLTSMKLRTPDGEISSHSILQIFPFTSESKRMGIILKDDKTNEIVFFMKGADVVMASIVQFNDWLEEEVDNMAREGLRTLVIAKKTLSPDQYLDFEQRLWNTLRPLILKKCR